MSEGCSVIRQQFEKLQKIRPQSVQKVMQDTKVKNAQQTLEKVVNKMEQEKKSN